MLPHKLALNFLMIMIHEAQPLTLDFVGPLCLKLNKLVDSQRR